MPSGSVHRSKTRPSSRMSHDVETEISRLTDGIAALRVVYALIQGRPPMPPLIEIKRPRRHRSRSQTGNSRCQGCNVRAIDRSRPTCRCGQRCARPNQSGSR